jgi:hypothetical protein
LFKTVVGSNETTKIWLTFPGLLIYHMSPH